MANNSKEEPRTAPQPDRWYNLTLGPSYHHSSNKFCTLRYEFKPASIDKSKAGKLHKTKENRVSVEFQNNQIGKPKVAFEGSTEDYKDNDAVLFFDGETFRLERLHRAVKSLRHVRKPGESAAAAQSLDADPVSPPVGRGAKQMHMPTIPTFNPVPVEVERIDIGEPQTSGAKPSAKRVVDQFFESPRRTPASVAASPEQKNDDGEENHDIDLDELFEGAISDCEDDNNNNEEKKDNAEADNNDDMNVSRQNDSDEEIADVDDSGDEGKGQNAADALRAQLNAEAGNNEKQQSSSSSSSSGSESGSGSSSSSSSSSSSGSEAASDDDSVNSV